MGQEYLIDSSTVIDYLSNKEVLKDRNFLDAIIDKGPNISVITRIEIQGKITKDLAIFRDFVSFSYVHHLTEDVIQLTIDLRHNHKIKIPDAIIAATAIHHQFILLTSNEKDFANIKGLKLVNPRT